MPVKSRLLFIMVIAATIPVTAFAGSSVNRTTITNLQINKDYGAAFVFIQVSTAPTGAPACASSGWNYTLSFGGTGASQLYAMLLTAYAAGTLVNIAGTGLCSDVGIAESLDVLQLTQ